MTTEQTARQLELAAQILRTGHPWEWQASDGEWVKPTIRTELHHVISDGLAIRLALATPPDGRSLHNPDNLTAEQVGVGWRLTVSGETATRKEYWHKEECRWLDSCLYNETVTYRLPLSVPWPEAKPDPYAELKKAHAEGKVIQLEMVDAYGKKSWSDIENPCFSSMPEAYRIKPEPAFTLPPPPPGMQFSIENECLTLTGKGFSVRINFNENNTK